MLVSRRSLLGGLVGIVACGCGGSITQGIHDPSFAKDLWVTKLFGRSPERSLVKRVVGPVPTHEEQPFFRKWQIGYTTLWPFESRNASETEIYEDASGEMIGIFRGLGGANPLRDGWVDRGATRAGVRELHSSRMRDNFRFFVLADGTWVAGYGVVALRLSGHFATESSAPPRNGVKPKAQTVQQFIQTPLSRIAATSSTALYAADQIRGLSVSTFAPNTVVPTSLEIVYPTSDLAKAAAQDLVRLMAASQNFGRGDGMAETFFRQATISADGPALVIASSLPFEPVASWLAPS